MALLAPIFAQVGLQVVLQPAVQNVLARTAWYWCVLACVSAAEAALVQRFPGYHHVKLLLLLWLQSRRYQGAPRLFRLLLRPALHQLRPSTEAFLARAAALAERPEAAAVAQSAHSVLASFPLLEWFVRSPSPPEDAPTAARSRRRDLIS